MNQLKTTDDLIDPNGNYMTVEELRHENGEVYWLASELMERLEYGTNMKAFYKAIERATKTMSALRIDPYDHIAKLRRDTENGPVDDYKLTRFGAYLAVMNADPRKPEVAKAQAYFVMMTRQFEKMWLENPEEFSRVAIREEVKEANKILFGVAKKAGVDDYARFQNAGYLGMYNMLNVQLAERRGISKDHLIDYMGRDEMAANLFRISMTEGKIETEEIKGQKALEDAHREVGQEVRNMVIKNKKCAPEDLPISKHRLPEIHSQLKIGHKEMKKIDKEPSPKRKKQSKKPEAE